MNNLHLQLMFLEPYRMVQWLVSGQRNGGNPLWKRAQGYARWQVPQTGYPYITITGTALRAAVIRAVEEELARASGQWDKAPCCPGQFYTQRGARPQHLRHRSTIAWPCATAVCTERATACPLCLILGRFDAAGKNSGNHDTYDVQFKNLSLPTPRRLADPQAIGSQRILNRVDAVTGKAHDWFRVWEIEADDVRHFAGSILIANDLPRREAVLALLERALGFVDRLCGSLVTIAVRREETVSRSAPLSGPAENGAVSETPLPASGSDSTSGSISGAAASLPTNPVLEMVQDVMDQIPKTPEMTARLRTLADAVRTLRGRKPPLNLPRGHKISPQASAGHYLWDKLKLRDGRKTLRELLESACQVYPPAEWRRFCECLGQAIYDRSQASGAAASPPPQASADTNGLIIIPKPPVSYTDASRTAIAFTHEWILTGQLVAQTPFFVGLAAAAGDHTSRRVLLDPSNCFRLPRTVLRGVLRRDLGLVTGQGCRVELGPERPCQCPVCQIMRQVALRDAISPCDLPPDIRHRIRRNHRSGTVNEGSLFDAESGLEQVTFPLLLRLRGGAQLPDEVVKVLKWWQAGWLFLGGDAGTGKGRFALNDMRGFVWNLTTEEAREEYAQQNGLRGQEHELNDPEMLDILPGLSLGGNFAQNEHSFPWRQVQWSLVFSGPALSNDPIAALCQDDADAIFYRKTVAGGEPVFTLRGEGLRGLVRTALGRAAGGLLDELHEDCRCPICRIFGSEHQRGAIRFEDMTIDTPPVEKHIDHVSIDRFDGGVVEKFDDKPLLGAAGKPLIFKGCFWIHEDIGRLPELQKALAAAFQDLRAGMYAVGAKGGTGYGWITDLTLNDPPVWLGLPQAGTQNDAQNDAQKTKQGSAAAPSNQTDHPTCPTPFSARTVPPLPAGPDVLYNPCYYLKTDRQTQVHRQRALIDHTDFKPALRTGHITCTVKVLSPLILPDASRSQENNTGHRTLPCFAIDDQAAIPASQIRAAISTVFEALTNSCLRVMKQKSYLSWRMDTTMYRHFRPGQVLPGATRIKSLGENPLRLPLYDDDGSNTDTVEYMEQMEMFSDQALKDNIEKQVPAKMEKARRDRPWSQLNPKERDGKLAHMRREYKTHLGRALTSEEEHALIPQGLWGLGEETLRSLYEKIEAYKINKAQKVNGIIKRVAKHNQAFLSNQPEEVLLGRWKVGFTTESLAGNQDANFLVAKLCDADKAARKGYLKITGPNNANVSNVDVADAGYDDAWENPLDYSFRLTGPPACQPNTQANTQESREFPRPGFTCVKDGKKYRITKRCERLFEDTGERVYFEIPDKIRDQYRDILTAYRDNADSIAGAFRTRLPAEDNPGSNNLQENDLVYFRVEPNSTTVAAIIPVCISREADTHRIGQRLPDQYRSCAHVCLEDCSHCYAKSCLLPLYREGALTRGLCPACHLFGAAGYKSRVRFGFGTPQSSAAVDMDPVTLPLQERPRPTWVLPKEIKNNADPVQIPGRKFYLRHSGWQKIMQGKDPITGNAISKGLNNISSEAIRTGTEFTFQIHFENLESWELGLLLYCLELEPGMAHAIGRGKNFGFGQVEVRVTGLQERQQDGQWQAWDTTHSAREWKITAEGLDHLGRLCGAANSTWRQLPHVAALRLLLTAHPHITARYPALDEDSPGKPPGYMQLKESGYNAAAGLLVQVTGDEQTPSVMPWYRG